MTRTPKMTYLLLACLTLGVCPARGAEWHLMDWIDGWYETSTPTMRQALGVDQAKVNCKSLSIRTTPAACISWIVANALFDVKTYIPYTDPATFRADALLYSAVSLGTPIPEVDVDDFFAVYESWYRSMGGSAATYLNQSIGNLKSVNHALKFGITVYEDELDPDENPYIDDVHLPSYIRNKVDVVRLFLHYRTHGPNFAAYVAQAKTEFPNAEIVAGVYSYDRIDYFPCSPNSSTRCTAAQEVDYFRQALNVQVQLLRQGVISGLDCFPGYFGSENKLYGSGPDSDQLPCKDIARCVQTTQTMRMAIASARAGFSTATPAGTPAVTTGGNAPTITKSPTNTSLLPGQTQIFSVSAWGTGALTYQWMRNGATIAGATSSSYHTPPVTWAYNNSTFTCRVSNAYGSVVSAPGLMKISD